jgi:hypothetical protein
MWWELWRFGVMDGDFEFSFFVLLTMVVVVVVVVKMIRCVLCSMEEWVGGICVYGQRMWYRL